jgi:hypothetical protein
LRNLQNLQFVSLGDALSRGDPGYQLLQWLAIQYDWVFSHFPEVMGGKHSRNEIFVVGVLGY